MAEAFTQEFGIANKFFRAGQEALQTRLEAEARGGKILADTIAQADFDVVADMIDRGLLDTGSRPALWDEYPEEWRYPKFNNIAFATLSCNMIFNNKLVAPADAPKSWKDLVSPQWKGKVVIPSPEYAGTGFALLADWVKRYGWDFIKALKANETFIAQAVSDSDSRVISGQKLVGIANSHRGSTLIGGGAPITFIWSKETPPVALSYVHAVLKKAPDPNAARLYRDYCLTPKVQSQQAKFGLWSAHPKATQPAHLPPLKDAVLTRLDWDVVRKERQKLLEGWRTIIRG
jgi:iron(III) transport system substrate-binding protein